MLLLRINREKNLIFLIFKWRYSPLFSEYTDKIADGRKAGLKCHFADCLIRIF